MVRKRASIVRGNSRAMYVCQLRPAPQSRYSGSVSLSRAPCGKYEDRLAGAAESVGEPTVAAVGGCAAREAVQEVDDGVPAIGAVVEARRQDHACVHCAGEGDRDDRLVEIGALVGGELPPSRPRRRAPPRRREARWDASPSSPRPWSPSPLRSGNVFFRNTYLPFGSWQRSPPSLLQPPSCRASWRSGTGPTGGQVLSGDFPGRRAAGGISISCCASTPRGAIPSSIPSHGIRGPPQEYLGTALV